MLHKAARPSLFVFFINITLKSQWQASYINYITIKVDLTTLITVMNTFPEPSKTLFYHLDEKIFRPLHDKRFCNLFPKLHLFPNKDGSQK